MILPLRQRHRRIMFVLGVLLPVTLVLGVAGRKATPTVPQLPGALLVNSPKFDRVVWTRDNFFPGTAIQARLLGDQTNSGQAAIQFSAPQNYLKPDLLVYWAANASNISNSLPADAVLLGEFGPLALPVPDEVTRSPGVLLLYSLADDEIAAMSANVNLGLTAK